MDREQIVLQDQKQRLLREAEELCANPKATRADIKRADTLIAQAANLRTTATLQTLAAEKIFEVTGKRVQIFEETDEQRSLRLDNESMRTYLATGVRENRTYSGMSVGTDASGGFMVPQSFYDKLTATLKQVDRLFDESVVTIWNSDHGNAATVPVINDTESAVQISENATSDEDEISVDRLLLGKVPTWRSKKIIWSQELLQDSSFDALTTVSNAVAMRYSRGIGAANVAVLKSAATSGATSQAAGAVSTTDLLELLKSADPQYLASPKCYWTMNFNTLIRIYELKDTTGRPLVEPRTDSNGNFLLFTKPVALCPAMDDVSVSAGKPIALGDMSKFIVRIVKGSMALRRYEQSVGLAENGMVAFEGFVRSNSGLLVASGADSPVKTLTMAS